MTKNVLKLLKKSHNFLHSTISTQGEWNMSRTGSNKKPESLWKLELYNESSLCPSHGLCRCSNYEEKARTSERVIEWASASSDRNMRINFS